MNLYSPISPFFDFYGHLCSSFGRNDKLAQWREDVSAAQEATCGEVESGVRTNLKVAGMVCSNPASQCSSFDGQESIGELLRTSKSWFWQVVDQPRWEISHAASMTAGML